MALKYIMTVGDVIYFNGKGHIVLGTKKYNRDENRIYTGKKNGQIFVGSDNFKHKFEVKDISISGDTVIGILIYDSENIHHIKVGDKVYSIIDDE